MCIRVVQDLIITLLLYSKSMRQLNFNFFRFDMLAPVQSC